jgi:hypothetical protein
MTIQSFRRRGWKKRQRSSLRWNTTTGTFPAIAFTPKGWPRSVIGLIGHSCEKSVHRRFREAMDLDGMQLAWSMVPRTHFCISGSARKTPLGFAASSDSVPQDALCTKQLPLMTSLRRNCANFASECVLAQWAVGESSNTCVWRHRLPTSSLQTSVGDLSSHDLRALFARRKCKRDRGSERPVVAFESGTTTVANFVRNNGLAASISCRSAGMHRARAMRRWFRRRAAASRA